MFRRGPKHLGQLIEHCGDGYGFRGQLDFPGFYPRQVQDVVDERQQVVSRRRYGLREFHLGVGQIPFLVVGQQLRENEGRVERRAQFMAHIRQELALVFVGTLQVGGLLRQHGMRLRQLIFLMLQDLGLFLELRVDLFELGLLRFQLRTRLLQRAPLLLQLLVVDAQFLFPGLQLVGLALCLLQQFLEPAAVDRCSHRNRDRLGDALEKLLLSLIGGAEEAELDDGMDHAVNAGGSDQQLARGAAADTRPDRQIARRHVADPQWTILPRRLPGQTFARPNHIHIRPGRQRKAGDAPEAAAFRDENRADLGVHVTRQEPEDVVAQLVERLISLHQLAQSNLPGAQP